MEAFHPTFFWRCSPQVKAWEEQHQGAMEERSKRCTALEAECKTLAASIEDTAVAFDESLASLAQVNLLMSCWWIQGSYAYSIILRMLDCSRVVSVQ